MADLTDTRIPQIESLARAAAGDLASVFPRDQFTLPMYEGGSILNLASALSQIWSAPGLGAPPLDGGIYSPLIDGLAPGVQRVVLILLDALSLLRLRRWIASGVAPVWNSLLLEGVLLPLTSIVPSTTSAALTALWTGRSAEEHGILGYELWLKEYGVVANMISHTAFAFKGDPGGLRRAGFDPASFLSHRRLGTHLAEHGVATYAFHRHAIVRSGLSQMLLPDAEKRGFATPADLWVTVRELLTGMRDRHALIWVYWDALDTISHEYGPDSEAAAAEFAQFSFAFEHSFLNSLSPAARRDTLLILAADHGQIATRKDAHYDLRNHPGLVRRLHLMPTGENRLVYLFIRPGQTEAVREYIERTWPNQFILLEPQYAVEAGLFGSGERHSQVGERLGDLILAARGSAYLWWAPTENPSLGRHGGLSPDEMWVPLLGVRL